jgi:hypothetical protein
VALIRLSIMASLIGLVTVSKKTLKALEGNDPPGNDYLLQPAAISVRKSVNG